LQSAPDAHNPRYATVQHVLQPHGIQGKAEALPLIGCQARLSDALSGDQWTIVQIPTQITTI